jgi:hypothetical protein
MNKRKLPGFLCTLVLISGLVHPAVAVCPNILPPDEQALWAVHNCDSAFRTWFRDAYNLQVQHWDEGWGWDECDPSFAFPKMLNAGYLLANGVQDETLKPWHSSSDYSNWGNAHQDDWRYEPNDANGPNDPYAIAHGGFWQFDRIEMTCKGINNSAGERAGTMLHEATHMVYWQWDHHANDPGSNCSEDCTDEWLFHELGEYGYGTLPGHKHSMNQIQIEFLCDLGEFADPWVPITIAQMAWAESNNRMNNRILNPPGWTCGLDRPVAPPPPPPPICPAGKKCCEPTPTGCAVPCIPESASCQ